MTTDTYLHMRMSPEDKERLAQLAKRYRKKNLTDMVLALIDHVEETKPKKLETPAVQV